MADVKWIKITTDIFDDEKILLIESLPDAYAIITVWFKLLCLAGKQNNSGVFVLGQLAYTDKMLATIFRMKESTVTMALQTFEQFEMVKIVDGVYTIPNWGKHQNLEQLEERRKYQREYQRTYREKQKLLANAKEDNSKDLRKCLREDLHEHNVNTLEEDIEEERELDLDTKVHRENPPYQAVVDLYHSICTSYPKIRTLSDARKKAVKARLKTYTLDDFKEMFTKAEASDFLKGKNGNNWSANFDWLVKDANMAKVLDGNYDNRKPNGGRSEIVPDWMTEVKQIDQLKKFRNSLQDNPDLSERVEKLKQQIGGG